MIKRKIRSQKINISHISLFDEKNTGLSSFPPYKYAFNNWQVSQIHIKLPLPLFERLKIEGKYHPCAECVL
ncbi:hypothetical protein QY96_01348 [Bacillus thermotolerans]|nr:hypothetical protein QY96_01348 [Bacillus thermotolerans]